MSQAGAMLVDGVTAGHHLSRAPASPEGSLTLMDRATPFSYQCNQCGLCCHDKVVTLSPYDVLRIARAMGISTADAVRRYTIRRGSILRFLPDGACSALEGTRCSVHRGRPLACRVYPLGIERTEDGERLIALEPATGSRPASRRWKSTAA